MQELLFLSSSIFFYLLLTSLTSQNQHHRAGFSHWNRTSMSRGKGSPVNLRTARIFKLDQCWNCCGQIFFKSLALAFSVLGSEDKAGRELKNCSPTYALPNCMASFLSGFGSGVFETAFDRLAAWQLCSFFFRNALLPLILTPCVLPYIYRSRIGNCISFQWKTGSFTSSHAIPFHFISCYFILFHFVSFIQKTEKLEREKETKASLNTEEETAKVERGMPTSHRNCLFPFGTCTVFAQSQEILFENNLGHRPWGLRVFCSWPVFCNCCVGKCFLCRLAAANCCGWKVTLQR